MLPRMNRYSNIDAVKTHTTDAILKCIVCDRYSDDDDTFGKKEAHSIESQ